ncbi:MAG: polyprenyl diphosphate synthase [Rickettsiaceae bacterium]|nr:polyprenyl diphosphate synthase [Rickettsiaceae bacterium]
MTNLNHVALIMDGNNRWAFNNRVEAKQAYRAGAENAFKIIKAASDLGIKNISLFAFSSENFYRPEEEVNNIISLIVEYTKNETKRISDLGAKVKFVGDLSRFGEVAVNNLKNLEKISAENNKINLYIMMGYGSREEIVSACKKIVRKGLCSGEINEETLSEHLYYDVPDVDLLIRSGDKMRISNFLLWQSAYAELHFSKKLWPDFSPEDLKIAVEDYKSRSRTFGRRIDA